MPHRNTCRHAMLHQMSAACGAKMSLGNAPSSPRTTRTRSTGELQGQQNNFFSLSEPVTRPPFINAASERSLSK
eukprot:12896626-Prorocentrum_lima.AAC.1